MSGTYMPGVTVAVDLPPLSDRGYGIAIRDGLLEAMGEALESLNLPGKRILVVTDTKVATLYLAPVNASLKAAGFEVVPAIVPAGENSKTLGQAEQLYATALQAGLTRADTVLALGGGVVGDLAGFAASTYHRGMALIQVPTTLVAQVDSAIGGKTAVNAGAVKNAVGTFHQPRAVLIDPAALKTLPERELVAGYAEVIKYGLIETSCTGEQGFFDWLASHADKPQAHFPEMIERCARIKAAVVAQDETETLGIRHYLNLGHSFGHAYESLSNYRLLHGEAVGIGLMQAAKLSRRLGIFPDKQVARLRKLLNTLGLSATLTQALCFSSQSLMNRMQQDKKNLAGRLRLILPSESPGTVVIREDVPAAEILAVFSEA